MVGEFVQFVMWRICGFQTISLEEGATLYHVVSNGYANKVSVVEYRKGRLYILQTAFSRRNGMDSRD
ncbi:Uncharacterised protein [Neisseria animalis]|nr:Uncharacterised protein [Neisseria animalis]